MVWLGLSTHGAKGHFAGQPWPLEDAYDEGFDPEEAYDENPYAGSDMIDAAEDPGGPRYGTL